MTQLVDEGFEIQIQVYFEKIISLLLYGSQYLWPWILNFLLITLGERVFVQ